MAGPRLAGSRGDKLAVAWGLAKMKELGFQNVRAQKVIVPHWERGRAWAEITAPNPQPLVLAALGGSVGTPEEGIEAEVIEVASLDALEKIEDAKVKDKIVFFNAMMARTRDGSGYGRAVAVRVDGASRAGAKGARAVVIRSVGTDMQRMPHTGGMHYDEKAPRIPAAALTNPDADQLHETIALGKPVRMRLQLSCRMLADEESANVIGEVPGKTLPRKIVLMGAHLDSWDLGTGAIDDGAGCAIVLEAARRAGALHPARTIRVVLFANEEWGLSGAKAYFESVEMDARDHVAMTESDFGSGRAWKLDSLAGEASLPLVEEVRTILAPLGVERGGNESGGGADISPFAPCKTPILSLTQDGTFYFDIHHTPNDTLDKVDVRDLDQNVAAYAVLAYVAADMPRELAPPP
ncbi:MAG: M20/M25/M40 family metallo-hydrolase [Acidobacteriota bacterium]